MLPQSVWADNEASLDGDTHTLTIYSSAAGNLSKSPNSAIANFPLGSGVPTTVTKIVLKGKFNANDLNAISSSAGFDHVAEVDMADAQFVQASSAGVPSQAIYKLFKNTLTSYSPAPAGSEGDRAIFNGTLYKSKQGLVWNYLGDNVAPSEKTTAYTISSTTDFTGRSINDYGKIAKGGDIYRKMHAVAAHMDGPHAQDGETIGSANGNELYVIHIPDNPDYDWVLNLILEDENRPYGYMFGVRRYYYCDGTSWKRSTEEIYNNATNKIVDKQGANLAALESAEGDDTDVDGHNGWAMSVVVYYTKTAEVREWLTDTPTSEQMAAATIASFDYAYRENHKSEFSDGTWVKMKDYNYYQLQGTGAWTWEETTYIDGAEYYIYKKYSNDTDMSSPGDGLPNADNQYAVKMGPKVTVGDEEKDQEYYYSGGWVLPSAVSESSHYVDMKFDYWKTTLQRATTSKYADDDINPEIFKECKALRYVDFKAGVVKGFGDHKTTEGYYTPFKIKISKDVTKIDNAAFRRCDVLTEVEWDTYTDDEKQEGSGYPKALIIEAEAFLQAKNLMSIKIPNRVTYIGDNAFEEVGTGTTSNVNSVDLTDNSPTFELIFERRHESDTDQGSVAINCDMPLTLGSKAFFNCWYLKELSLPIRLKQMGDDCFKNSLNLTTLEMREETNSDYAGEKLRTIPSGAFEYSGVHEVTIPKSVTKIVNKAFGSTTGLTKVTFQDNNEDPVKNLIIESGAFSGGREEGRPQLDIYAMVNPYEEGSRKLICEYAAFNYTQTVGQTSTLQNFAILHFPEDAWDYYQGNWKRGLAFRQNHLNAFKDGYHDDVKGYDGKSGGSITTEGVNAGKYVHATEGKQYTPANGWQEFARTSTTIDIVIPNTGSFLRTYSTKTPKAIPLYAEVDTEQGVSQGDPFFKVYRISHFNDKYSGGSTATTSAVPEATATEVKLYYNSSARTYEYENTYIPASTGLLMVGFGNGSVSYVVYMNDVEGDLTTYPFTETQYEELSDDVTNGTNLLFPSCEDDAQTTRDSENGVPYVYLNPTYPYPYASNTVPDYRFFGLAATSGTPKTYYFGRFVAGGKVTRDKAYLKLTNNVFHWKDGTVNSNDVTPNHSNSSRVALNFFEDEEESGTTGIKQVDTTAQRMDSNVFYTLEGVKLNSRPTQRGIYIHNGRKIVIK